VPINAPRPVREILPPVNPSRADVSLQLVESARVRYPDSKNFTSVL
jgi:hypothetical protein